jgi:hypothetical protein
VGVVTPLALIGCSGSGSSSPATYVAPPTRSTVPATTSTTTTPVPRPVWLCRPGLPDDPCTSDLTATVVPGRGPSVVQSPPTATPRVDCFYVYPTVSTQPTANADLTVDPQERAVAVAQAARFSSVCNVYAPMYPQITRAALAGQVPLTATDVARAYLGVADAWTYYLRHLNHGHGIVVIGHSQGASLLMALLARQVDGDPSVRDRLVSAILLGGNVTVPTGSATGGTFAHLPLCTSFDRTPPADALFGRVAPAPATGTGTAAATNRIIQALRSAAAAPTTTTPGAAAGPPLQVACVDPVPGPGPADASSAPPTTSTVPAPPGAATTRPGRRRGQRAAFAAVPGRALTPYFPTAANPAVAALGTGVPTTTTPPGTAVPTTAAPTAAAPPTTAAPTTPWVTYPLLYKAECLQGDGATWLQVDDTNGSGGTRPVVTERLGPAWGLHLDDVNLALGNLVNDVRHQAGAWLRAHGSRGAGAG